MGLCALRSENSNFLKRLSTQDTMERGPGLHLFPKQNIREEVQKAMRNLLIGTTAGTTRFAAIQASSLVST